MLLSQHLFYLCQHPNQLQKFAPCLALVASFSVEHANLSLPQTASLKHPVFELSRIVYKLSHVLGDILQVDEYDEDAHFTAVGKWAEIGLFNTDPPGPHLPSLEGLYHMMEAQPMTLVRLPLVLQETDELERPIITYYREITPICANYRDCKSNPYSE